MQLLKTKQDLINNIGKKVQFTFDKKTMVWRLDSRNWDGIVITSDTLPKIGKFTIDINWYIQGISYVQNIYLLDDQEEKKPSRIKHKYTTSYTRDDGVVFTEDSIDGISIDELKKQEQDHYYKARDIRWKLNAHLKLFPNKK